MRYFLLVACIFFGSLQAEQQKPTICLNMIIKNESQVIRRCLQSVKPLIDYWVIVDTGSTDGTQDIVREFMQDIPGELYQSSWVDFEHNRNEALQAAHGKGDYLLFIDADEVFECDPHFQMPLLDKDFYHVTTHFNGLHYARVQLINNHLDWKWKGVLHEAVVCDLARTCAHLPGIQDVVHTDGARSKDPRKYHKDAAVLEAALEKEPNNTRYMFYLAQSYRDAEEHVSAFSCYIKRVAMGGWDEEIFESLLQIASLAEKLDMCEERIVSSYESAYRFRPSRLEPLCRLANYYRRHNKFEEGYQVAKRGLGQPLPKDLLFLETWVYDYELLLEFSVCAYWTNRFQEAKLASLAILAKENLPAHVRACAENNLQWCNTKLRESTEAVALN